MMISYEEQLVMAILGQDKASVLMTDAYKLSMAQAGFPLREETFVLSFRRGEKFYIPFDLRTVVLLLLPALPTAMETAFLETHGYELTPAMLKALMGTVTVNCPPIGSWVFAGEPVLTVTGPSFLVSWLEALLIMLHYPIQIATAMKQGIRDFDFICPNQAKIIQIVAGVTCTKGCILNPDWGYLDLVGANIRGVVAALRGEPQRAFEVGLRAATCIQQHFMVLDYCKMNGIGKTSNMYGALHKGMTPVGTTGHEHQMRWAAVTGNTSDLAGFRAIRDMRSAPPSYLFDTTDPEQGIKDAFVVIHEDENRTCALRLDSGNHKAQTKQIVDACCSTPLNPMLLFEDGYDEGKTIDMESYCNQLGVPRMSRGYGYGGYFVSQPARTPYNRDAVSAAYKLSMTGGVPVMKFSGSPGKESIPGRPCILEQTESAFGRVVIRHLIAQQGEVVKGWSSPKLFGSHDFDAVKEPFNTLTLTGCSLKTTQLITGIKHQKFLDGRKTNGLA